MLASWDGRSRPRPRGDELRRLPRARARERDETSDSTEAEDRGSKWLHYQRISSLRHYILVSQHDRRVEVYTRDGPTWRYDSVDEGTIALSAIDATISLDDLHRSALGS